VRRLLESCPVVCWNRAVSIRLGSEDNFPELHQSAEPDNLPGSQVKTGVRRSRAVAHVARGYSFLQQELPLCMSGSD